MNDEFEKSKGRLKKEGLKNVFHWSNKSSNSMMLFQVASRQKQ